MRISLAQTATIKPKFVRATENETETCIGLFFSPTPTPPPTPTFLGDLFGNFGHLSFIPHVRDLVLILLDAFAGKLDRLFILGRFAGLCKCISANCARA